MSKNVAALDPQKTKGYLDKIMEQISTVRTRNSLWVTEFQEAVDKSSGAAWMNDVLGIGDTIDKQAASLLEAVDDIKTDVTQYAAGFQEATDTRISI